LPRTPHRTPAAKLQSERGSNPLLHFAAAMAVPKRKQSKSRRDKRRANYKLSQPAVHECPQCHQPKRPHRVCPTCGTYRGREVEPVHTPAP
jgi:large subunit ribosomal protein L32